MKKSQAFAEIMALKGVQPLKKIIKILLSIDNFKQETIYKLKLAHPYTGDVVPIEDIWVDLSYQRKLGLQAIINRLIEHGRFDKEVAGHIDLAIRTDGRLFVWDGFHRVIMATIARLETIPASIFAHDKTDNNEEQVMKEARMFKIRNSAQSPMKPEQIFKSEVRFRDPEALQILDLLKECRLDVEGTNDDADALSLGGFAIVRKKWNKIDRRYFIDSAEIIRKAFPKDATISVILWCGLAKLLEVNNDDRAVKTLSFTEISDAITDIVSKNLMKQSAFTQPRIHGKPLESTATNILKYALQDAYNDNGQEVKSLINSLGIDEDELYD